MSRKSLWIRLVLLAVVVALLLPACGRRSSRGGGGGGGDDDDSAADDDDAVADDDDAGPDDDDAGPDDDDAVDADSDGDGLTDAFEAEIGTDPQDRDTDGDGFEDGTEHLNYFFADDPTDFPYLGDYPRGPIPDSVAGEGWSEGQISRDWTGTDQHGQALRLHRFYGNVVVVELAAEW